MEKRKPITGYSHLFDRDILTMDFTMESIHAAVHDADDNNYALYQVLAEQNRVLLKQVELLKEQIGMMDMKINYLLDNPKK